MIIKKLIDNIISQSIEDDYTFQYNKDNDEIELITQSSMTCHTRHTLTKNELYTWYKDELNNHKNGAIYWDSTFREYADFYGMSFDKYLSMINNLIDEAYKSNPEYFI